MKNLHFLIIIVSLFATSKSHVKAQTFEHNDTLSVYTMHGTIYADMFVGRKTANGEIYTQDKYTAAHWKFKFGTLVLVTNINTGQQVIVRINDRCPKRGVIDLTRRAANSIGIKGCQKVNVQVLPERYYDQWQNQNGDLSTPITPHQKKIASEKKENSTQQKQDNSTSQKQNITHRNKTEGTKKDILSHGKYPDLYNILISVVNNRTEANKIISKLPYYYQNKVSLITENNKISIIVNTSMQHPQAQKAMSELIQIFPNCKLVKLTKI